MANPKESRLRHFIPEFIQNLGLEFKERMKINPG